MSSKNECIGVYIGPLPSADFQVNAFDWLVLWQWPSLLRFCFLPLVPTPFLIFVSPLASFSFPSLFLLVLFPFSHSLITISFSCSVILYRSKQSPCFIFDFSHCCDQIELTDFFPGCRKIVADFHLESKRLN